MEYDDAMNESLSFRQLNTAHYCICEHKWFIITYKIVYGLLIFILLWEVNMKRCFILVLSIILSLAGCSSELSEYEQAALVAEDFFEIIYDIDNYNQVKFEDDFYSFSIYHNKQLLNVSEYFTENGFTHMKGLSYIYRIIKSAYFKEMSIEILSIEFDNVIDESTEGKMFFDYSIELLLTFGDGITEVVIKEGKIKLLKTETWKIDHIKEINFPLKVDDELYR
jgi:hypothetical protein